MNTDKLKFLKLGGQYKVKSFARLMEEYGSNNSSGTTIDLIDISKIGEWIC